MPLLIGFVAGVLATLGAGAILRERARQRAQIRGWDRQWAREYAAQAEAEAAEQAAQRQTFAPAPAGPRPGESFAFRMPTGERPVVVDAVVVDPAAGGAR